jgi:hypothetical protein
MKPIMISDGDATASIAKTISFNGLTTQDNWELDEIKLHLSAVATAANSLVVRQKSFLGDTYNAVLLTTPMVGVADVLWQPERPIKMNGHDKAVISWTNDAGADGKAYGLQVHCKA